MEFQPRGTRRSCHHSAQPGRGAGRRGTTATLGVWHCRLGPGAHLWPPDSIATPCRSMTRSGLKTSGDPCWRRRNRPAAVGRVTPDEYDVDYPRFTPRYQQGPDRRPRVSRQAQRGPVKTFVLRVNHRALPNLARHWCRRSNAGRPAFDNQQAFDWADDHLYSFS
jgi:hypothetical protein